MLDAVAERAGLSPSVMLRQLVRQAHARMADGLLEPQDLAMLQTLPIGGSFMSRPVLSRALARGGGSAAIASVSRSIAVLLRLDLVSRDGSRFALTPKGKTLI